MASDAIINSAEDQPLWGFLLSDYPLHWFPLVRLTTSQWHTHHGSIHQGILDHGTPWAIAHDILTSPEGGERGWENTSNTFSIEHNPHSNTFSKEQTLKGNTL